MTAEDKAFVMGIDTRVDALGFQNWVLTKTGFVLWEEDNPVGMMDHRVLWDRVPFLNFLDIA